MLKLSARKCCMVLAVLGFMSGIDCQWLYDRGLFRFWGTVVPYPYGVFMNCARAFTEPEITILQLRYAAHTISEKARSGKESFDSLDRAASLIWVLRRGPLYLSSGLFGCGLFLVLYQLVLVQARKRNIENSREHFKDPVAEPNGYG